MLRRTSSTRSAPASSVRHHASSNPVVGRRHSRCIGLPLPDTEARVVDPETGNPVAASEDGGELQVRGPQIMKGYWHQEAETSAVLRDGWLSTGDMVRMDKEGFFFILDRKKDMIKSGGLNVYPREVDECLCAHPKVKEACVLSLVKKDAFDENYIDIIE